MNRIVLATVGLCLCLSGCLTPTQRREESLMLEARQWNDDFRWGRWDVVMQSMPQEERRLFQARQALVGKDLVMADYDVTTITFLQGSQAATLNVGVQWYRQSNPIVHSTSLVQRWEQRNGRWTMVKQRRVSGDRFPLVPEPVEQKPTDPAP